MNECLDQGCASRSRSGSVSDLLDLLRAAHQYEVEVHGDVAGWVTDAASIPDGWTHGEVRELLRWDPSEGLYEAILLAGDHDTASARARGEVVSGVCLAYLDLIGVFGGTVDLGRTFEREEAYLPVSCVVLRMLAPLTCRGLAGVGGSAGNESTLLPGEISALILGAVGASSFTDRGSTLMALDGISGFGLPQEPDFGRFKDVWNFGVRKLISYHPDLDRSRLPGHVSD